MEKITDVLFSSKPSSEHRMARDGRACTRMEFMQDYGRTDGKLGWNKAEHDPDDI